MNTCPNCGNHSFYVEVVVVARLAHGDYAVTENTPAQPNGDEKAFTVCTACDWYGSLGETTVAARPLRTGDRIHTDGGWPE